MPPGARFAVAANFAGVAAQLAERYRARSGERIELSSASSGQLYSQIAQGAPFDGFLSADALRPRLLEEAGLGVPGTRFTYVRGQLVLWAAEGVRLPPRLAQVRTRSPFLTPPERQALAAELARLLGTRGRLAMADPKLAPYGKAAEQALKALGLWTELRHKLLVAESVLQVHRFVATGNAPCGFVSRSQVQGHLAAEASGGWVVPGALHEPLAQQAVLLRESQTARAFLAFLASDAGAGVMRAAGYIVPSSPPARR